MKKARHLEIKIFIALNNHGEVSYDDNGQYRRLNLYRIGIQIMYDKVVKIGINGWISSKEKSFS